ncbi:unnamed protein product [Cladocopium goreaui]|uniref:Uncharacterized protein n=1 Tax=Cladocopium goreaui TaxID=2562237 RepID=A0A9P1DLE4_9DINO|nr:unnamed protein product [Cladocopium goreaui]
MLMTRTKFGSSGEFKDQDQETSCTSLRLRLNLLRGRVCLSWAGGTDTQEIGSFQQCGEQVAASCFHGFSELQNKVDLFGLTGMRTTLWKIEADGGRLGPQLDAVGLACNPLLGSLWVLYADRSLSYFSEPLASRDACWTLPGAISDLRSAQGLPGHVLTKVVTYSPTSIQLWSSQLQGDLRLEAQSEPAHELSTVAVSPWLVACGLSNGEVRLFAALHGLAELGPLPMRHGAEVLSLSFGHWKPASLRPIILASVSSDRSILVFSIEVQGESGLNSSQASLLLHLQHHSGPVHHVSLLASPSAPGSEVFRMVVCTADQLIWRELEYKDGFTTVHKCARQQACRGSRWVGSCADTQRGIFFAACSNRRLLQLDPAGRRVQEMRVAGGNSAPWQQTSAFLSSILFFPQYKQCDQMVLGLCNLNRHFPGHEDPWTIMHMTSA